MTQMPTENENQSAQVSGVPLQPVVGSLHSDTPRTDQHIAGLKRDPELSGCDVKPFFHFFNLFLRSLAFAATLERELAEALCAIRQLLNDGVEVQNLNTGEFEQFRADVDGIVAFLEATDAKARAARSTSNTVVHQTS